MEHETPEEIRTYTLHDYTVPDPDGGHDVPLDRPLAITVGSQALEPNTPAGKGKTLVRFTMAASSPLLDRTPKMRVKILTRQTSPGGPVGDLVYFKDPLFVELLFDNETYLSEHKEMPFWLVDVLEYAAKTLRSQYEMNQQLPVMEEVDETPWHS